MVLKPKWLLNALYILAFNGRNYSINGIIAEKDIYTLICEHVSDDVIKKVWGNIIYRPYEIQYIINVLLDFELIYRIDNHIFFIPMLCDENKPKALDSFNLKDHFHVQFVYTYLPENVLHRLMVRYGKELDFECVWRAGALFVHSKLGWKSLVCANDNCLNVYIITITQKSYPMNAYFEIFRESIYDINADLGLTPVEYWAYSQDGKEDYFEYKSLIESRKTGIDKIYSTVFNKALCVNDILNDQNNLNDHLIEDIIEFIISTIEDLPQMSINLRERKENELTVIIQSAIAPVMNEIYGIWITREFKMGRNRLNTAETDLCFIQHKSGFIKEILFCNCKEIYSFKNQYMQLVGYLNPNFLAGVTLSINRTLKREEAYDYIYNELMKLRSDDGVFAPISISRKKDVKMTKYIRTEHIVPETGLTMQIFHLALQLSY